MEKVAARAAKTAATAVNLASLPQFPTPALRRGHLLARLGFGQVAEHILDPDRDKIGNFYLEVNKQRWYEETRSRTICIDLMGRPRVITSDPRVMREVLGTKADAFTNGVVFKQTFGSLVPKSMIVVDGPDWVRIRKVCQRAMNKLDWDTVVPIMCGTTDRALSNLAKANCTPTWDLLNHVTFDTFHLVTYGWDPKSTERDPATLSVLEACNELAMALGRRALSFPLLWKIPNKENRAVWAALTRLNQFIEDFVQRRRSELKASSGTTATTKGADDDDDDARRPTAASLLDAMILASDSGEDGGLTPVELRDQILTFFLGAFETTSGTLGFMLSHLAKDPKTQDKLRQELLKVFPRGREDLRKATMEEVESVAYLNAVVDETNRLTPVATMFVRCALRDVEVGGHLIPKDAEVFIDHTSVGRDPAVYGGQQDLATFRPDRYFEVEKPTGMNAPLPFGSGSRICLGRKLALNEMKVFLADIIVSHRVTERVPGQPMQLDLQLGQVLKRGTGEVNFEFVGPT